MTSTRRWPPPPRRSPPGGTPRPASAARSLLALADAIEDNIDELKDLERRNVGKPVSIIDFEFDLTVDNIRFFAGAARTLQAQVAGEYLEDHTSMLRRDPLGVCAGIAPWNYPLNMATWKFGPALAAGNTFVLKPSELTPLTALKLAELAADILPPGVFNVVCGQGETAGDALVRHPGVAMVSITGDVETGKLIARNAADTLKRVHLELGGKAPVVVFDDADLDLVVEHAGRELLLQLGPGLHRPVPGGRRARHLRRPGGRARLGRVGAGGRRPVRRGHRGRPP